MKILLLGPPGVGKGTIAKMLEENFCLRHLSSGDFLREAVKLNTLLGRKAKMYMEKGELVPDEVIVGLMKEKINEGDFILDGFPRNVAQAKSLEDENITLDIVLNIKASEEVIIFRLSGRKVCSKCDKIYHMVNMPPQKEEVCDSCGGKLIQRKDDELKTIKRRLQVYKEETQDLVKYYEEKGILKNIDANGKKGEVYDKISALVWSKKRKLKSEVKS